MLRLRWCLWPGRLLGGLALNLIPLVRWVGLKPVLERLRRRMITLSIMSSVRFGPDLFRCQHRQLLSPRNGVQGNILGDTQCIQVSESIRFQHHLNTSGLWMCLLTVGTEQIQGIQIGFGRSGNDVDIRAVSIHNAPPFL